MRILDSQRYWSFFKAYVICYVSLVGLFIVIDAFSNMDEFTKRADGVVEMAQVMGRYYLIHQSLFFDYLCGVIGMMAAIFTVTWMQRNNEQLAILAAGVSTHRAIRPVLVSSVIVSTFAVANQELIMPRYAEELAKSHDDDGQRRSTSRADTIRATINIHAVDADRATKTIMPFYATIPHRSSWARSTTSKGQQANVYSPDHPTAPLKGGWLVRRRRSTHRSTTRQLQRASRESITPRRQTSADFRLLIVPHPPEAGGARPAACRAHPRAGRRRILAHSENGPAFLYRCTRLRFRFV